MSFILRFSKPTLVNEKIIGHINLRCGSIDPGKLQMQLGMGVETLFRSAGIGNALLKEALGWAQQQKEIAWLDLSVFSSNHAAKNLYKKHGFGEIYTVKDAFRIEGESIDDVQMELKLR